MITINDSLRAGRRIIDEHNEDCRRGQFLRAIDESGETLSEFELAFVKSFLEARADKSASEDFQWFTPGRRQVVDNMIHRYGFRSLQLEQALTSTQLRTDPGRCAYRVWNEATGRRAACNAPATHKTGRGLELCEQHRQLRAAEIEQLRRAKEALLRR